MKKIDEILLISGQVILNVEIEGTRWIPIKIICESLSVDFNRQFKNIKKDMFLRSRVQLISIFRYTQRRKMLCIPEHLLMGYVFTVRSKSHELIEYKKRCYDVLYKFFKGEYDFIRKSTFVGRS